MMKKIKVKSYLKLIHSFSDDILKIAFTRWRYKMKAIHNYILAGMVTCLLVFGCSNSTEPEKNDTAVPNKLSSPQGENELTGKSFQNTHSSYGLSFSEDSVTYQADANSSSSLRSATASTWTDLLKYQYSWNSESDPKTLEFQLRQVWGTGVAQGYEEQLAAAKKKVSATAQAVNEALANDTLYSAFDSAKDKAKSQVTAKGKAYTDSQQQLLETYLKAKYESVIKFTYELTADTLTLTEQFKKNLTDASSNLTGTSGTAAFTLNDYRNLIPFKVVVDDSTYVGVPELTKTGADSGSLSVQLYPYYGDMTGTAVATKIAAAVQSKLTTAADVEKIAAIASELATGETSPTLDGLLNEAIGGFRLEATYALSDTGATLTFTKKPNFLSTDGTVAMTHQPLLGGTFNLAK